MRELSLHILDLAQNSIVADAKNLIIEINENENGYFVFRIIDDGRGMNPELLEKIRDPFVTTRNTRKVGMGIPFLDMVTKQCNGSLHIASEIGKGTFVEALFDKDNIDRPPLGNLAESIKVLLAGSPNIELKLVYKANAKEFVFTTQEIKNALGDAADFAQPELCKWVEDFLNQEISRLRCDQEE